VLAVRGKLRANTGLRQAARQADVPVYAIRSRSSSNLVRAFKTLLGLEPGAGVTLGGAAAAAAAGGQGSKQLGEAAGTRARTAAGSNGAEEGKEHQIDVGSGSGSGSSGDDTDGEEGEEAATTASSSRSSVRMGGAAHALQQEEDGLEEARLAAEQIVMPLQQPVELLPRPEFVRRAQAALCERYSLGWQLIGRGGEARVRVMPQPGAAAAIGGSGAAGAVGAAAAEGDGVA
jgi:hypothetical protein